MEDLREEIKQDMLQEIKTTNSSDVERAIFVFRSFVDALRIETEAKSITKPQE